jgi:predicted DNA-binding transcriptional regulator AlpA
MQIEMQNAEALSGQQIAEFLKGSEGIAFCGADRASIYQWTEQLLIAQEYAGKGKKERGAIRRYACKVTGLSLPQMTRLIRSYRATGTIAVRKSRRRRFPGKYTEGDVRLLAEVDNAHERLSGPATKCILRREHEEYGKGEYARLAGISVAHIYNLRASPKYRRVAANFEPTRPSPVSIGERRRPEPLGRPGFLRIDTVHQGDWDGEKGIYHINAVDAVTQFEVVGCAPRINAENLKPVLEAMLHQFPFPILGAHFDNGSEYINYSMDEMLKAMMVEFTKSRACRSQDNALVEGKNGAIIRKLMGYGHIPAEHAGKVHAFYAAHLNPYLNFHRPCGFATVSLDARGKRERTYKTGDYATPHQKLRMLPGVETKLKPGISIEALDRKAAEMSDTEFARRMGAAKIKMLRTCRIESPRAPRIL